MAGPIEILKAVKRMALGQQPVFIEYPITFRPRWETGHPHLTEIIAASASVQHGNLAGLAAFLAVVEAIEARTWPDLSAIDWHNHMIPVVDALSLMWAATRARTYMEVGSGNSTLFVRAALRHGGKTTRIVSIDPAPRAEVDAICDEVIRQPVENVDLSIFDRLEPGDALFIDNSHRSFMNSDVTVCMTEVIPRLKPGVLVGVHDMFLPYDYPASWSQRGYNEQYLLAAMLLAGPGYFDIQLANHWLYRQGAHEAALTPVWDQLGERARARPPSAFWAVKRG